jgi:hypothetical protein
MIVRRRTWLYRLAGQRYPQSVSFDDRVTAAKARSFLRRTVGNPLELWGRNENDVKPISS